MPTIASCLQRALLRLPSPSPTMSPLVVSRPRFLLWPCQIAPPRTLRPLILVSASAASSDELNANGWSPARTSKDLHEVKRKNSALQMQQFVGEEKNDLLDYLRSLQPEKVLELSEPTSSEVQEIIHSVAHCLLATLSPKIHSKPSPQSDNIPGGAASVGKDDWAELLENTCIHLQPLISVPRDYLARLLFWCLLLGHYVRGLEHRLELMQLLTIPDDFNTVIYDDDFFR